MFKKLLELVLSRTMSKKVDSWQQGKKTYIAIAAGLLTIVAPLAGVPVPLLEGICDGLTPDGKTALVSGWIGVILALMKAGEQRHFQKSKRRKR